MSDKSEIKKSPRPVVNPPDKWDLSKFSSRRAEMEAEEERKAASRPAPPPSLATKED